MYKILVPVDFSEKSNYAVKMAAKIGKNIEAEIYLLHLVELPSGIVDMGAGSNFSIPESMMYLRKVKEKGNSIIPIRLFINKTGKAKLEIALAKGKKIYDKRESIKEKDQKRDLDRIKNKKI